MDDSGVLDMSDLSGIALTYWHVMDSGRDSVDLLKKLLDRFGHRLRYVLVRNQLRGDDFGRGDAATVASDAYTGPQGYRATIETR